VGTYFFIDYQIFHMTQTQSNRVAVVDTNRISGVGGGAPAMDLCADHLQRASPVGSSGGHLSGAGGGAPVAALCTGHLRRATLVGSSGGLLYWPCCSGGHLLWDASAGSCCGVAGSAGSSFGRQPLWLLSSGVPATAPAACFGVPTDVASLLWHT